MTYEEMNKKIEFLLVHAESEMNKIIEDYNENNEDGDEIDTVDLSSKFSPLRDYVEDYTNKFEVSENENEFEEVEIN